MRAEARPGALRVDAPQPPIGPAGLAGHLGEVRHRHRLDLLGQRAQRSHVALRELDLVRLDLPQLAARAQSSALICLAASTMAMEPEKAERLPPVRKLKPSEPVSPMIGRTLS